MSHPSPNGMINYELHEGPSGLPNLVCLDVRVYGTLPLKEAVVWMNEEQLTDHLISVTKALEKLRKANGR